jgi:hypothetical protein
LGNFIGFLRALMTVVVSRPQTVLVVTDREPRPIRCDACGQTEGPIDAHSEDYSEPFGDHIGEHALCYRCHMAIHTREKNPEAWAIYKTHDLDQIQRSLSNRL